MKAILMSCNNCNEEYAFNTVSQYIKPHVKIVCVPFASELHWQLNGDFEEYKQRHFSVFKSFGVPEENITIASITDKRGKLIKKFIDADVIFFSGGHMENLLYLIKSLNLGIVLEYAKNRKLFIGESAGTLALLDKYIEVPYIEDSYKEYKEKTGLKFVTDFNIIVHYNDWDERHRRNKEVVDSMNDRLTICLSDRALMIVDNNEFKVLGDYKI